MSNWEILLAVLYCCIPKSQAFTRNADLSCVLQILKKLPVEAVKKNTKWGGNDVGDLGWTP